MSLPIVGIREVLSTMDPFDIFYLSQTSKRCRSFAKLKNFPSDQLLIILERHPNLLMGYEDKRYVFRMTDEKEKDGKRETSGIYEVVHFYSDNSMEDFNKLYINVVSVMNKKIGCVSFFMNHLKGKVKESVGWVKQRFHEVERIRIHGPNVSQEEVQYVLDNVTPTFRLQIMTETIEKLPFRIEGTFEELQIENGSWITVDHAMSFNYPCVTLSGTNITNQELNKILKSWIDMKCHLNTKQLEINLMDRDNFLDTVLESIPYEIGEPIVPIDPDHSLVEGGYYIKRNDGLAASIYVCEGPKGFSMGLKKNN
ncbi:unnamed protein product [Caenorhabditis nigoni]